VLLAVLFFRCNVSDFGVHFAIGLAHSLLDMADGHPLSGSPEDMELPTLHSSSPDDHSDANGSHQTVDVNRLQLKLSEAESVHASLLKGT
jgi:hypothetical protein